MAEEKQEIGESMTRFFIAITLILAMLSVKSILITKGQLGEQRYQSGFNWRLK